MFERYSSALCSNCGRDKRIVAKHLNGEGYDLAEQAGPPWLKHPYCFECVGKHCLDFDDTGLTSHWQCQNIRAVEIKGEHPAVYQDYCPRHIAERATCHRSMCNNPKPAWDTLCPKHRADADRQFSKQLVADWKKRGLLCDDCRSAKQNSPQRYCQECLGLRGIPLWKPVTGPWLDLVKSMAVVPPDGPQNPRWLSKVQDEKAVLDPLERNALYARRVYARKHGLPVPPLPPKRAKLPKPKPKRTETKYRRQFWTGSTEE